MDRDTLHRIADDPAEFRRHLLIDCGGTPRRLADVAADFQVADFGAMDAALRAVAGLPGDSPEHRRAWIERTRGSSKTQDAAVMALWLVGLSRRQVHGVAVAADQNQAGLLQQAILRLIDGNGWIVPFVEVGRWEIKNPRTGSTLRIMASDERSSWGLLIDFAILDEVSAWPTDAMFVSILSALGKKSNTVLLSILNAGWRLSWAYKIREQIRADERWYFSAQVGHAPWISEADIAEQKRLLPPASFARLWRNEWSATQGDAFTEAQVEKLAQFDAPMIYSEPQYTGYAIGCDIGTERHHSSVAVLAIDQRRQVVRVAHVRDFAPPVQLDDVLQEILRMRARYGATSLYYDPYQCIAIAQHCAQAGMAAVAINATPSNLGRAAVALTEAIRDERVLLYRDGSRDAELLVEDLLSCQVVERPQGYKIELGESPGSGHSDRLSAVLQALPDCLEASGLPIRETFDDGLGDNLLQYKQFMDAGQDRLDGFMRSW